jgi:pyridoxamine 5'-phosphate oxidase
MPKTEPVPGWYDDLVGTLAEAWRLLARGAADRRSGFHTPMAASLGRDGRPRARVIVLRGADPQTWTLRFHTDRRSEKFGELLADPRIALSGYDAGNKIQMRIEGRATLHTDDALADAAWLGSREMSRAVYGILPGPGQELVQANAFTLPGQSDEIAAGRSNFCAVTVQAETLEWLYLASSGHRRALFERRGRAVTSNWLSP